MRRRGYLGASGFVSGAGECVKNATGKSIEFNNSFHLARGPYEIISVMDESVSTEPCTAKGKVIDLSDPTLPVLSAKTVKPGEQAFLYNIGKVSNPQTPKVLAAAPRVYGEKISGRSYSFTLKSPAKTTKVMRILLPSAPKKITITGADGNEIAGIESSWDSLGNTSFLNFENNPDGIKVVLEW